MTFTPPYTNTFRTLYLDFSISTHRGLANCNIYIPFPVDEVIFHGVMSSFPPTDITNYFVYTCDQLTNGDVTAPIGWAHYTGVVDTVSTSTGVRLAYMYQHPTHIQGQYVFLQKDDVGMVEPVYTVVTVFVEFRKYN